MKMRLEIDPLNDPQKAFHVDMEITEEEIATLELDELLERCLAPALAAILSVFEEPYTADNIQDIMMKNIDAGNLPIRRAVRFFRDRADGLYQWTGCTNDAFARTYRRAPR